MSDKAQLKEQENKLKELAKKPVSDALAKSIKEKQKYLNKPISK